MQDQSDIEIRQWAGVIGRALAFLCLASADLRDKDLADQARFLTGLGLSRKDSAAILDSTENSIAVVLSRKKRRATRGKSKAGKTRPNQT